MRSIILLLLFAASFSLKAQDTIKVRSAKVNIEAVKNAQWSDFVPFPGPNALYIGMDNLVKVTVPAKYKGCSISLDHGNAMQKSADIYELRISQFKDVTIKVLYKGKVVGSKVFTVKKVPMPKSTK